MPLLRVEGNQIYSNQKSKLHALVVEQYNLILMLLTPFIKKVLVNPRCPVLGQPGTEEHPKWANQSEGKIIFTECYHCPLSKDCFTGSNIPNQP